MSEEYQIPGREIGDGKYYYRLLGEGPAPSYVSDNPTLKVVVEERQEKIFDGDKIVAMRNF